MARILLIDANESHAAALARFLEASRYHVIVQNSLGKAMKEFNRNDDGLDVVALDMSDDRPENWQALDTIHTAAGMNGFCPMILCFSRIYRGPRMKLGAERKGARFIYVR